MREMSAKGWVPRRWWMPMTMCWVYLPMAICADWLSRAWTCAPKQRKTSCTVLPAPWCMQALAVEAADLMESRRITSVLVVDAKQVACVGRSTATI
jgi:hypothetical protein